MKRVLLAGISLTLLATLSGMAHAQQFQYPYQYPAPRPAVSPYINLGQAGVNPGIQYYGIVRPQFEFRRTGQLLQNEIATVEQQQQALAGQEFTANVAPTGSRPAQFQTQARYFLNNGNPPGGATAGRTAFGLQGGILPGRRPTRMR